MNKNKKISQKNKTFTIALIIIVVVATIIYFSILFINKNKVEISNFISNQKNTKENIKDEFIGDTDEVRVGYLVKMNENSIDFISLEDSRNNDSEEERQKKVETFYISLSSPATPVLKGIDDEKKDANLSDLKVGQEILLQYDKETKNAIRIIINEAIKK